MTDVERPPLTLTLSTGEKIKMTYGLEMDLRRMLPDPDIAMNLALNDPITQDHVIRRCLTKKNAMLLDAKDLVEEVDPELTVDDTEAMVMWSLEHVLYFFVKRTLAMARLGPKYQEALPNQSTAGSKNSPSTTPSAGPSE